MTTTKAARAVITLGNIELDVFQLPDGAYQISQSQTTNAVNKPPKRMVELSMSEKGQILIQSGFEKGLKVKVDGSKPVNLIPLEVAFQFWVLELAIGNQDALALVVACGVEALERRADAAFGILRTEEDRNNWLAQRADSKLYRRPFTDKLADENARNGNKTNYGLATLRVYKRANLSERYKAWKCLPDNKIQFRDTLTTEELANVIEVENMIVSIMNRRRCTFDDAMEFFKQSFEQ
jgi:hypothetical protein